MKVAFACSTIFHFEHIKQIHQKMDNTLIIIFTSLLDKDKTKAIISRLEIEKINYCHISDFLSQNKTVDVLFSVFWQPAFLMLGENTLHIRVMYGYAKDYWNYARWNSNYDLIFTYGPYATRRLTSYAPCAEVGNPRVPYPIGEVYSVYNIDGELIRKNIASRKKIILYCPTWGELSSFDQFDCEILSLLSEYDVFIKLHHLTDYTRYPNTLRLFRSKQIQLFDERTNLFDLLLLSDFVISDYSGAIYDAMLLKKKIILLDKSPSRTEKKRTEMQELDTLDSYIRQILPHSLPGAFLKGKINKLVDQPITYKHFLPLLYSKENNDVSQEIVNYLNQWMRQSNSLNRNVGLVRNIQDFVSKDNRRIVICGAGELGQAFLYTLPYSRKNKVKIVDRDTMKIGRYIDDVLIEPESILNETNNTISKFIVATVAGAESYSNILEKNGALYGTDYIYLF